ncbi:MAG: RraA family protein [Chloroflexota bacterium]
MIDFEMIQAELYSGVISDVLDALGYRQQTMSADIRPVHPDMVVVGRARTVLSVDVYHVRDDGYDKEIAFVDALQPDEVVVACTNRSTRTGLWGELLSTAARARGARGTITDGFVRDVKRIVRMGFPVFAVGMRPVDSRGRSIVFEYDVPIECGGVPVQGGDLIFGDIDGVVVVPQAVVNQAITEALHKVRQENASRAELEQGGYLRDVYAKYQVL